MPHHTEHNATGDSGQTGEARSDTTGRTLPTSRPVPSQAGARGLAPWGQRTCRTARRAHDPPSSGIGGTFGMSERVDVGAPDRPRARVRSRIADRDNLDVKASLHVRALSVSLLLAALIDVAVVLLGLVGVIVGSSGAAWLYMRARGEREPSDREPREMSGEV